MEQFVCVLGGVCLLVVGIALRRVQPPDWTSKHLDELQQRKVSGYGKFQNVVRAINNCLISLIGAIIVGTAAVPHGRVWALLWSVVFTLILFCILLAMLDAFSSLLAYRRTLPATMRHTLGDDSKQL
jgi:ABC-type multidrug transport system fused ATPase/permease subunit